MQVRDILTLIIDEYGQRNQITPGMALALLNQVQQIAFNRDLSAFLESSYLIDFTGQTQGSPIAYPSGAAGDVRPACRRMLGVTLHGESVARGWEPLSVGQYHSWSPAEMYVPDVACDDIRRVLRIPDRMWGRDDLRMVYYYKPPSIASYLDDQSLWIPEEFHHTLCVQVVGALAEYSIYGAAAGGRMVTQSTALAPMLGEFWASMMGRVGSGSRNGSRSEGSA